MLDNKLIISALALTRKTISDMRCDYYEYNDESVTVEHWFSIEKMCYYLLSQEFSSAYYSVVMCDEKYVPWWEVLREHISIAINFLMAIREYQEWNEVPLTTLLTKTLCLP